jgi:membrane protein
VTTTNDRAARLPGGHAETPAQIPPRGWWQVLRRAFAESKADNVPMLAGGVAFFAFLALFPTLIAAITLYGLVADPAQAASQIGGFAAALPDSVQPLLRDQLTAVAATSDRALGISLVVSLLAALWSASSGISNLMQAVNFAYDEEETRGFVKLRATALALTLGGIMFVLVALALVAVAPLVLDRLPLGVVGTVLAQVVRWGVLLGVVIVGLAVVYRLAPDRADPQFRWTSSGALVAAVLWIVGSAGFSLYVNNFGSYNKTYGALAGVIVLMLWLFLTSYIVLLGAEINAESERQTVADTTTGRPEPLGGREAQAADEVAEPPR